MRAIVLTLLIGYIGIGLVVIIHELGHMVVARLTGIQTEVFSFGLGPKLWSRKIGETEFRISLLPIGGFCRLKGSDDLERALDTKSTMFSHVEQGSLYGVRPWTRFLTYFAGPAFNFLLAALILAVLASRPVTVLSTPPVIATVNDYPSLFTPSDSSAYDCGLRTGDVIEAFDWNRVRDWQDLQDMLVASPDGNHTFTVLRDGKMLTIEARPDETGRWGIAGLVEPVVGEVKLDSVEENAGLRVGDRILVCNGQEIHTNYDLLTALYTSRTVSMTVRRQDGSVLSFSFAPLRKKDDSPSFGFCLAAGTRVKPGAPFSYLTGVRQAWAWVGQSVQVLGRILRGKVTVEQELSGTGKAAILIGDIALTGIRGNAASGFRSLFYLLAIVSVSLAVSNLIPLPGFDGGQILIAFLEMILRRQIAPKHYLRYQIAGFLITVVVMCLMSLSSIKQYYYLTVWQWLRGWRH